MDRMLVARNTLQHQANEALRTQRLQLLELGVHLEWRSGLWSEIPSELEISQHDLVYIH
jgi:hypothetical protein